MLSAMNKCIFMKELIEYDPNIINEVNCKKENSLIVATKINKVNAVETLLNYGIDVDQQDDIGNTALHYALEIENPKIVKMIMEKNSKMDLRNENKKTARMLAEEIGNKTILEILDNPNTVIDQQFDVNKQKCMRNFVEAKTCITPYVNTDCIDKCTKEMNKTKNEIYSRYTGPSLKNVLIGDTVLDPNYYRV